MATNLTSAGSRSARWLAYAFALLVLLLDTRAWAAGWDEADFEPIASGIECPASVALRLEPATLTVGLRVDSVPGATTRPAVMLGLAAVGKQVLSEKDATVTAQDGGYLFTFTIPADQIAKSETDWAKLRLGAGVTFSGGAYGQPLYRNRYRHQDGRAVHGEFSADPDVWRPFDLNAYRQRCSDRRARLLIAFYQPLAGKATLVIEDGQGRRVRNLISGRAFAKGRQQVEWDLLDDDGKVVPPGDYAWRSIHHAGIAPEYLFSYANDGKPPWRTGSGEDMWGPDHSCITTVASLGGQVYFLSPCAEAGYQGAITDLQGVKHAAWGTPTPVSKFQLANDGKRVFVAADNGQRQVLVRWRPGRDWEAFGNGQKEIEWGKAAMNGFGKDDTAFGQANWNAFSLAGFAACGGKLAVSSRDQKGIILFDAETGNREQTIPLAEPGALAGTPDGTLLAVSGSAIVRLVPGSMTPAPFLPAGKISPGAMTCSRDGKLYVIDNATCQIVILDLAGGREIGRLGKPGGAYAGAYVPERMVNPLDLAIADNGWLWVTENRFNPKRVLAWDLATGKIAKEKFGSTGYGAPGGGFDTADSTRWVGQGAIWKMDLAKKQATPSSILFADATVMPAASHWRFVRRDGRTFLLGYNSCNSVVEINADGSGRLLAQYGSAQGYCFGLGSRLSPLFLETFYKACGYDTPEKRKGLHEGRIPHQGTLFVWSDRNGDGAMQAEELEFNDRCGGGYWGSDAESLDIVVPLFKDLGGRPGNWRMELPLVGWYPGGAPKWKPLAQGEADAKPTLPVHWGNESALSDRNGVLYINGHDQLLAYGPDAALRWSYPNRWAGVHGSHEAPLPEPGQLQGALFFLGNAPLDEKTDVFILNGNHGRFFVLTSDGFYLDEFFKDVRMGAVVDAYMIGGECFGGFFGRAADDKQYYLLSGHTDYRIFRVRGFDSIVRGPGGKMSVTPAQIEAADRRALSTVATVSQPKSATITWVAAPPSLDGSGKGWPEPAVATWAKSGEFPVQVQAGYDAANLYVRWSVEDPSPWSNHGADEKMLFKAGDSVDLQIGVDPAAISNRTAPAPGDMRLLIAPFQGKSIAMLYRHRVAGAKTPVPFSSPWRTETVDEVRRLTSAKINVHVGRNASNNGGYIVEAAIPLADLGFRPAAGQTYRGDFGVIFGDPDGQMNQLRSYWSNQATGLVNDVPGEIMLFPNTWGSLRFEGSK